MRIKYLFLPLILMISSPSWAAFAPVEPLPGRPDGIERAPEYKLPLNADGVAYQKVQNLPLPHNGSQNPEDIKNTIESYLTTKLGNQVANLYDSYFVQIPATDLRPEKFYVEWRQKYAGVDVDRAGVSALLYLRKDGAIVVSLLEQALVDINHLETAELPGDVGYFKQQAAQSVDLSPNTGTVRDQEHFRWLDGQWVRTHDFVLEGKSELTFSVYRGRLTFRENAHYLAPPVTGDVYGLGIAFDPYTTLKSDSTTLDMLPLRNLEVNIAGQSFYTDSNGHFSATASGLLNAGLSGPYVDVLTGMGSPLTFSTTATSGSMLNIVFNQQNQTEYTMAQVNAMYHINVVHDYIDERVSFPGLNSYQLPVATNQPGYFIKCNGRFDETSVSITLGVAGTLPLAGLTCINPSYDTFLYHEYGHYLDHIAGTITDYSLSEGWGDVVATYVSGQPLMGENHWGAAGSVRTSDNSYVYDIHAPFNPHEIGQAWAGFAWHTRENLITSHGPQIGVRMAENLFIPALAINAPDIPLGVLYVLALDDDDANFTNGTPNALEIIHAAYIHGLFPLIDPSVAEISAPAHQQALSRSATPQVTVTGTASELSAVLPMWHYDLFYSPDVNPPQWTPIGSPGTSPVINGTLGLWDISGLSDGVYKLRVVVTSTAHPFIQHQYTLDVTLTP